MNILNSSIKYANYNLPSTEYFESTVSILLVTSNNAFPAHLSDIACKDIVLMHIN